MPCMILSGHLRAVPVPDPGPGLLWQKEEGRAAGLDLCDQWRDSPRAAEAGAVHTPSAETSHSPEICYPGTPAEGATCLILTRQEPGEVSRAPAWRAADEDRDGH